MKLSTASGGVFKRAIRTKNYEIRIK